MFPARAGMSRVGLLGESACRHVPRASGDEPLTVDVLVRSLVCSPRERG